jgi:hypothetical protein
VGCLMSWNRTGFNPSRATILSKLCEMTSGSLSMRLRVIARPRHPSDVVSVISCSVTLPS